MRTPPGPSSVVDKATGEVCVAGATCLENVNLGAFIGIVVVGKGAAAGQSAASLPVNYQVGELIDQGLSPAEVLEAISATTDMSSRQFGIATFDEPAVTFNGPSVGVARPTVTGSVGTLRYAIQGNVLAGDAVVLEAEKTLLSASGDLGQRMMAAMETARSLGGDGRCSCNGSFPTSCGTPPPSFTHSAYTAFIIVSRIGDTDGATNWAQGSYYLRRRFVGDANDIDAVIGLRERYDLWRQSLIGVTDGVLSEVVPSANRMPADGTATLEVDVRLRDIDGNPLAFGGHPLYLRGIGGTQPATVESVTDNGDGTYHVTLRAGTAPGLGKWRLVVMQDGAARTLHPPLEIHVDPVTGLHAGMSEVSAADGAAVPLVVNAGAGEAGRSYLVLASASGTSPGTPFFGQILPLNRDRLLRFTYLHPGAPTFPGSVGQLDAAGRAVATLNASSEMLSPSIGDRFDFSAVLFGEPNEFTDPVGFDILP